MYAAWSASRAVAGTAAISPCCDRRVKLLTGVVETARDESVHLVDKGLAESLDIGWAVDEWCESISGKTTKMTHADSVRRPRPSMTLTRPEVGV